ncbi:UNVERIFIED_CONTAM: hypothetical protein FKN15_059420, partial [Acipenser sinensis]
NESIAVSLLSVTHHVMFLLPEGSDSFNIDTKEPRIIQGSKEAQFGYTVQQHEAGGQKWLLVGAPFETNGQQQTGDIYRCLMNNKRNSTCSKLNLGRISLTNVAERKDKMRLGMTLTTNPKDNSFVTCGPLWSHECGSSYYSTGICSRVNSTFKFSRSIAPAFQRCETYMDIVIVLDGSNSIYPWYEVQNFLINILQKFYIGPGQIQVGVVQYGEDVVHEFQLNDYKTVEEVVNAARNIEQRGGAETRTAFGIEIARSEAFKRGGRRGSKKVMIVITDGESHDSPDLEKVIKDSEKDNITRYAIAVLGYYNRRGINPKAFLKEIKHIASDPDDKHFFNVADESALKDIVDALGERIFSLEGTNKNETSFGLEMSQAGFSSHIVEDGILVGAVGAYDWNGAVLMETGHGRVIPPKEAYLQEFPEELKNHGAYLGYTVTSLVSAKAGRLYVAGAPRFNHTGKVIIFTLKNNGNLTILHSLNGQQSGDGITDALLVGAPMYFSQGWEKGKIYIYRVTEQRIGAADLPSGLMYFGRSIHGKMDLNQDGLVDLAVGSLGAAVLLWSRSIVQIHATIKFEPAKVNIFNKDCKRNGKDATCMAAIACLNVTTKTPHFLTQEVALKYTAFIDERRYAARAILDDTSDKHLHKNEPAKVNIFNKDCKRNGKDATCMAAIACLNVTTKTPHFLTQEVVLKYTAFIDERRYAARAILDDTSDKHLHKNISVLSGVELCDHIYFHVFETTDYMRPVVFTLEYGMLYPDDGPVLDDGWPTVVKSSLSFWNGCDEDERCIPDLTIHSTSDIPDAREFCRMLLQAAESLCGHHAMALGSGHVIQSGRRRLAVDVVLKNRGENAYSTQLNITYSHNLHFASLTIKDNSDIKIECGNEDNVNHNKVCNVSLPFFRSQAEVAFRLDFEFSSDGEEDEMTIHDNSNVIFHQLKYEAELLFTRDSSLTHYEIKASNSLEKYHRVSPPFNFTFQLQNLGFFPVQNLLLNIEIPEVTKSGNRLLELTDFSIDQKEGTFCTAPNTAAHKRTYSEDLSHYPQLNHSNAVAIPVNCSVNLQPYKQLNVHISGVLRTDSLETVKFKSLALVTTASIAMEASGPMFLREDKSVRHLR